VHAGTYSEQIHIRRSGTEALPITLTPAGDGTVTIDPSLPDPDPGCTAVVPTRDRAIEIVDGTDYWTLKNLTIVGGILISADFPSGFDGDLIYDRTLPGRGLYDPAGAETTLPSLGVDPADGIKILNDRVTRRGINVIGGRFGRIAGNDIGDTICGSGAVILFSRFSDFWTVRNNFVHDTPVHLKHWMSEGIRVSAASNYNLVELNTVEDMAGQGRGITTDGNAGWNVIRDNTVRRALHGYNEQTGGWGNQWTGNRSESNLISGYAVNIKDEYFLWPDDGSPRFMQMRCNVSVANPTDLTVGLIRDSVFEGHDFAVVQLGVNLRPLWGALANLWEGSPEAPAPDPPAGVCTG
jgi:hypothetical protein